MRERGGGDAIVLSSSTRSMNQTFNMSRPKLGVDVMKGTVELNSTSFINSGRAHHHKSLIAA